MKTRYFITNGLTFFIALDFGIASHNIDKETEQAKKDAFAFETKEEAEKVRRELTMRRGMSRADLRIVERQY